MANELWMVASHSGRDSEPWNKKWFDHKADAWKYFNSICDRRKQGAAQIVSPAGKVESCFSIPSIQEVMTPR